MQSQVHSKNNWSRSKSERGGPAGGARVGVVHVGRSVDRPAFEQQPHQQHPGNTAAHPRTSLAWAMVMGCFGGGASKSDAEESKRRKEANKKINQQIQRDKQVYRATHRLLLLGKPHVKLELHQKPIVLLTPAIIIECLYSLIW